MLDRPLRSTLAVLALCAAPLCAADVDAGIDLWKTLPGSATRAQLNLPAGFFGTTSLPVNVTMTFKGAALETKPGTPSLGIADTVIERLQNAHPVTCGPSDTVHLRIAALHLVGESSFAVLYPSTLIEGWTVEVYLSDAPQDALGGAITIRQSCDNGGTFDSRIKVRPKFIFTRTSDQLQRVLDWAQYPDLAREITFGSTNSNWARRRPAGFALMTAEPGAVVDANHDGIWEDSMPLPGTTSDFVVGARPEPCSCAQPGQPAIIKPAPVTEAALLAGHQVNPPTFSSASFPRHKDEDRDERNGKRSAALQALPLLSLGLLALAIVAAAIRR